MVAEEFDLVATVLDRISEKVEELADDQDVVLGVIDAAGGNYGPDESHIVKQVIRRVSNEVLDLG